MMNTTRIVETVSTAVVIFSAPLAVMMAATQIAADDRLGPGASGEPTPSVSDESANNFDDNELRPTPSDIERLARDYKELVLMTPRHVYVDPILAASCMGVSLKEVEAARVRNGPHAHTAVKIYMNELAAAAFRGKSEYPAGAVVIKEKQILRYRVPGKSDWEPEGNGVGGMIKRPAGFDPEFQDWEYFYFADPKQVDAGRMQSCRQCHARARGKDFVFGSWQAGAI